MAAIVLGIELMHRFTMLGDRMDRLAMDPLAHVVDIDHAILESFCASRCVSTHYHLCMFAVLAHEQRIDLFRSTHIVFVELDAKEVRL